MRRIRIRIPAAPGWAALHEQQAFIPEQRDEYDVPPPPILTFPRPGLDKVDNSKDITLRWDNEVETTNSQIQIARDKAFTDIIIDERYDKKSFVLESTLFTNPLYWRVRQRNPHGYRVCSVSGIITNVITASGGYQISDGIVLYPNPALDVIKIKNRNKNAAASVLSVQIYSIQGRIVVSESILASTGEREVSVAHLVAGVYIAKVKMGEKTGYFRVVKQ